VRGRPRAAPALALLLAPLLAAPAAGCGYAFTTRYVARGGAERIRVAPFENRSTEPELGAAVTAALRGALARRGAAGGADAAAVIEGEVAAADPVPSSPGGATFRVALEVRARLVAGATREERTVRREVDYLAGEDPLESEGRRAVALRRAADEVAADVLRAFER
jgi:hypothetical protein